MPLLFLSPLHKAHRQITLHLEPKGKQLRISPAEGHLLTYLRVYGPSPIGDLLPIFGHPRSTLGSILDRLEKRRLLTRTTRADDRRSVRVGLTGTGMKVAEQIQHDLEELEHQIRRRVTDADIRGFQTVMAAISTITEIELRKEPET